MAISIFQFPSGLKGIFNPIVLEVTDTDSANYETFSIEVLIEYEQAGLGWQTAGTAVTPGINTGALKCDLAAWLQDICAPEFPGQLLDPGPWLATEMVKDVRLTITSIGNGVVVDTNTNLSFKAVRAGVNRVLQPAGVSGLLQAGQFMSYRPAEKLTTQYCVELIYYMRNTVNPVKLRWQATYTDGTKSAEKDYGTTIGGAFFDIIIFGAGYITLNLGNEPKQVWSWECWVADNNNEKVSQSQVFQIDCYEDAPKGKYFMFENSLGGWDTVYFYGNQKQSMVTSGQTITMGLAPDSYIQPVKQAINTRYVQQYEINSGYMPPGHSLWLRDLLISENVRRMNGWEPEREDFWSSSVFVFNSPYYVIIDKGSIKIREDVEDLDYLSFSYTEALADSKL